MSLEREAIPPGTLEMLILQILARKPELHGFEIAEAIGERSGEVFGVEEGSLYPALQRLLAQNFVRGEWGRTAENRRARYYCVTAAGRKKLDSEVARYRKIATAISLVLQLEGV